MNNKDRDMSHMAMAHEIYQYSADVHLGIIRWGIQQQILAYLQLYIKHIRPYGDVELSTGALLRVFKYGR